MTVSRVESREPVSSRTARNLFIQGNERTRSLLASNYQCYGRDVSERDNSFASVKVAYSLDYGKKVNHSLSMSRRLRRVLS